MTGSWVLNADGVLKRTFLSAATAAWPKDAVSSAAPSYLQATSQSTHVCC